MAPSLVTLPVSSKQGTDGACGGTSPSSTISTAVPSFYGGSSSTCSSHASDQEDVIYSTSTQQWLDARFQDLKVEDLKTRVHIIATSKLEPPEEFAPMWSCFAEEDCAEELWSEIDVHELDALVIIANPFERLEGSLLADLNITASEVPDMPPLIFMRHSNESMAKQDMCKGMREQFMKLLLEDGIANMMTGEPSGFELAIALRACMRTAHVNVRKLECFKSEFTNRSIKKGQLLKASHDAMWNYWRPRACGAIPAEDPDIPHGELSVFEGHILGRVLGSGSFGTVFQMEGTNEVVKAIDKSRFRTLKQVRDLSTMIQMMSLLSTVELRHACLARFFEAYHSPTHIFLRMETGGMYNLDRRLRMRIPRRPDTRPLSVKAVGSIMLQLASVIEHLHSKAHICHLDLKPENVIISEDEGIAIKLVDFDMAIKVKDPTKLLRSATGTVPFTAPEVHLARGYYGFHADMWSFGVILIELQCGSRILEEELMFPFVRQHRDQRICKKMLTAFTASDDAVSEFITRHSLGELEATLETAKEVATGVLKKNPLERWDAGAALNCIVAALTRQR